MVQALVAGDPAGPLGALEDAGGVVAALVGYAAIGYFVVRIDSVMVRLVREENRAERRYNAASVFKRAAGAGRITHYEGLDRLLAEYGEHVAALELLPVGAPRRDWRATLIADGMVIVRHPELPKAMEIAQRFAADLRLYAG